MDKTATYKFFPFILILIVSCTTHKSTAPSATPFGPRTIILDNETFTEEEVEGFTSWYCKDFIREEQILVEVGFFGSLNLLGFILYDGGFTGDAAMYQRMGLEHRWDWGSNASYAFVIKTDGTGLYYDFSSLSEGETTRASDVYKCYKR